MASFIVQLLHTREVKPWYRVIRTPWNVALLEKLRVAHKILWFLNGPESSFLYLQNPVTEHHPEPVEFSQTL
jgi:hypothetical protein